LVAQNKSKPGADVHHQTHDTVPDKKSSDMFAAVAVEGFLNYKVTHHEGKVGISLIVNVIGDLPVDR